MRSPVPMKTLDSDAGAQRMDTYDSLKQAWEEAADKSGLLDSFAIALPEVFRRETLENQKEHYQELQELLGKMASMAGSWDLSDPERLWSLSGYLLLLARTALEIDEEVFDHRMNVVREYRRILKAFLAVPWARQALGAAVQEPLPSCLADLPKETGREALERVRESIQLACENKILLREKYEPYLAGRGPV